MCFTFASCLSPSTSLAFIPVTAKLSLPLRMQHTASPENHGIAEVMLQLELILQPCEQAMKKSRSIFQSAVALLSSNKLNLSYTFEFENVVK